MSDFLFALPGFFTGMGSAIDIGSTLMEYNASLSPNEADYIALCCDWNAVGVAMSEAVQEGADVQ
jgi:hypothetical protein